jgi:hypothetical protein
MTGCRAGWSTRGRSSRQSPVISCDAPLDYSGRRRSTDSVPRTGWPCSGVRASPTTPAGTRRRWPWTAGSRSLIGQVEDGGAPAPVRGGDGPHMKARQSRGPQVGAVLSDRGRAFRYSTEGLQVSQFPSAVVLDDRPTAERQAGRARRGPAGRCRRPLDGQQDGPRVEPDGRADLGAAARRAGLPHRPGARGPRLVRHRLPGCDLAVWARLRLSGHRRPVRRERRPGPQLPLRRGDAPARPGRRADR